jgi:hypothetical protein
MLRARHEEAPITVRYQFGRHGTAAIFFVGGCWLLLITGLVASQKSTVSATRYHVALSVAGAAALFGFLGGLMMLRCFTLRLWPDRLTYHHILGRLTVPKVEIASVAYETMSVPANPLRALAWLFEKPYQPRLKITMSDTRVIWLYEFWAPPPKRTSRLAVRASRETADILVQVRTWLGPSVS